MKQTIFSLLGIFGLCMAVGFGVYIEIFCLQTPCILCFLQRAAMLLIAIGLYWNVMRGIHVRHYAFCFLSAWVGFICCLRHMALNVCKSIQQGTFFFCSYRLYTWSFVVFMLSIVGLTALLFAYTPTKYRASFPMKISATILLSVVIIGCAFSTLYHRGVSF